MSGEAITPVPLDLPPGAEEAAGRGFDAAATARALLRLARTGSLATLDPSGCPLATLVHMATDQGGAPVMWLSGLSLHTRNLMAMPRCSLLIASPAGKGDPLSHPRLTLSGTARQIADPVLKARWFARHPKARLTEALADFSLWRLAVEGVHLNGGFGRAGALEPADIGTPLDGVETLAAVEADAVAHMNRDHAEAAALIATRLGTGPAGAWKLVGLDPAGLDFALHGQPLRVDFPRPITGPDDLRAILKEMADAARALAPFSP